MWITRGSAHRIGLNGRASQPRKPQMKVVRSLPVPPSVTSDGSSPAAMLRKNATASASL